MNRFDKPAPVSVIIPCYRCRTTISRAVRSVDLQTYRPAELILVDDASGDGTREILELLAQEFKGWIRVLALDTNRGPSAARNLGWDSANQDYIAFLDSDDSWDRDKLQMQLPLFDKFPELTLIGHPIRLSGDGDPKGLLQPELSKIRKLDILLTNPFQTSSVVMRRNIPFRFDEGLYRAEDYLLWAEIVLSGRLTGRMNRTLATMYKPPFGAGGLTEDEKAMRSAGIQVRKKLQRNELLTRPELWLASFAAWVRMVSRPYRARSMRKALQHQANLGRPLD